MEGIIYCDHQAEITENGKLWDFNFWRRVCEKAWEAETESPPGYAIIALDWNFNLDKKHLH